MPRKNPVTADEQKVCVRIFEALAEKRWSITTLAFESGVETHNLLNFKHLRACIKYEYARCIVFALDLNADWLATGFGEMFDGSQSVLPHISDLKVKPSSTFLEVYPLIASKVRTIAAHKTFELLPGKLIVSKPVVFTARELARHLATILSL